jgi:hypothetical protein
MISMIFLNFGQNLTKNKKTNLWRVAMDEPRELPRQPSLIFLWLLLDLARLGAAARSFTADEVDEGAGLKRRLLDANRERPLLSLTFVHCV